MFSRSFVFPLAGHLDAEGERHQNQKIVYLPQVFKYSPAVARDRGDNLQLIEKQLQPQKDCVDWVRSTWQEVEREIPVATRQDELETGQEHWDRSAFVFVYGKLESL